VTREGRVFAVSTSVLGLPPTFAELLFSLIFGETVWHSHRGGIPPMVLSREIADGVERGVAEAGVVMEEAVEELPVGVQGVAGVRMSLGC